MAWLSQCLKGPPVAPEGQEDMLHPKAVFLKVQEDGKAHHALPLPQPGG